MFKDYGKIAGAFFGGGCITKDGKGVIVGFGDGSLQHWEAEES